ncbi:hypothetical protein H0X06_00720 [Candidatus Dependentiae bacterium]|nr:hypothetical protein [Candidatus Dependentiae bacterium]
MIQQTLFLLLSCTSMISLAQEKAPQQAKKTQKTPPSSKKNGTLVPFSFDKKNLIEIVESLTTQKGVTLILPQGNNLEILRKQTVTFQPYGTRELPFDEAWTMMLTFLELSRFALSEKKKGEYTITPIGRPDEPGISREVLPLFVNTPYDQLPKSDARIRYLFYLQNLKTPSPEDRETNPIARIFKDLLSAGSPVIYEPKSNGFIITDKASTIASAMMIISELDKSGYKETITILDLHFIPAAEIVKVFEMLRKAAGEIATPAQPFIRSDPKTESLGYFASDTKIIADNRQNRLIVMGRESAVERISDFVTQYMDTPPETGQSVLHYYDLQYLDAKTFAEVLSRVVSSPEPAGPQARVAPTTGPERYFQGVVVMAEEIKEAEAKATTEEITLEAKGSFLATGLAKQTTKMGGNRLIVAALQDDWQRIVEFIQSVDKPQRQVILEVLIVDVISTKSRIIAGTTRTREDCNAQDGVQFLSSNISPVNNVLGANPQNLNEDLLQVLSPNTAGTRPVTSLLAAGSLIISINDPRTPGVSSLIQVLDSVVNNRVLSHPYLVTTNNQLATIASQEIRRAQGDAVPGAAGVVTIEIIDLPATLQVQMVPRISSLNRLSLQIAVDINEFVNASSSTRTTRRVNTNANMASGEVLVIGGLTRVDQLDRALGTPLLNRIPLLNIFFSNKTKTVSRTNLAILISPTIIEPKLRGGADVYTTDKIRKSRRDIDDSVIFGNQKDPITRLFFRSGREADSLLQGYLSEVINPPDAELIKTKKERLRDAEIIQNAKKRKKVPVKAGIVKELPA